MDQLINKSKRKIDHLNAKHKRSIYNIIDRNERLILLLGHRGSGKTTLLLQFLESNPSNGIYMSLDDFCLKLMT